MPQRHGWNTGFKAGFTAPAGHMRMAVNKPGYQCGSGKVKFCCARHRQLILLATDSKDPAAANQDMANSEIFRREDSGIGKEL